MFVNKVLLSLVCTLVLVLSPGVMAEEATAHQDEIVLKNGSRIVGTVTASRDGVITVDTDFAGTLEISADKVASVNTVGSLVIQMNDGRIIRDQPIVMAGDRMTVSGDDGEQLIYAAHDILLVNPEPWELGDGYKWSGLASFGLTLERGNSDTDEADYKLESIWRSLQDRYTLRMDGEIDEANDQKSADNWMVIGKYDRFLEGPLYWGVNASAEQDEFTDLDLRYYVGPYMGKQFYDEPIFSLSGELGLAYVNEDFIVAEDQDYPGANWNVHATSNYLGGKSRLYVDHIGIWNLDETTDIILNTTFGLAFPLIGNLEGAAEVLLEYDSGAVEGIEKLDQTYNFRIGYSW